jgi:hypothetical protein
MAHSVESSTTQDVKYNEREKMDKEESLVVMEMGKSPVMQV